MRLGAVLAYHRWVALVVRSRTRGFGKGKVGRSGLGPVSWLWRCDGGCHENGGTLWMGMVCDGGRGGSMAWMREVVGCGFGWNGTIVVVGRFVHQAHGGGSGGARFFYKRRRRRRTVFIKMLFAFLLISFCTPVPHLPLLFQGVSASGLPTKSKSRRVFKSRLVPEINDK
jgi:hypothetical protein